MSQQAIYSSTVRQPHPFGTSYFGDVGLLSVVQILLQSWLSHKGGRPLLGVVLAFGGSLLLLIYGTFGTKGTTGSSE